MGLRGVGYAFARGGGGSAVSLVFTVLVVALVAGLALTLVGDRRGLTGGCGS